MVSSALYVFPSEHLRAAISKVSGRQSTHVVPYAFCEVPFVAEHGFVHSDRLFNGTLTTLRGCHLHVVYACCTSMLLSNILILLLLPIVFSLCRSIFWVVDTLVWQSPVGMTQKWSRWLGAFKGNTGSALKRLVLPVFRLHWRYAHQSVM